MKIKRLKSFCTGRPNLGLIRAGKHLTRKIEPSLQYPISSRLNAAAIVHKVNLMSGKPVSSRLITVVMNSKAPEFYNPLNRENAQYQCYHSSDGKRLYYSCGSAHLFTERLVGVQISSHQLQGRARMLCYDLFL